MSAHRRYRNATQVANRVHACDDTDSAIHIRADLAKRPVITHVNKDGIDRIPRTERSASSRLLIEGLNDLDPGRRTQSIGHPSPFELVIVDDYDLHVPRTFRLVSNDGR